MCRNNLKVWHDYFGSDVDCVSLDFFLNMVDIVYNDSQGISDKLFAAVAEALDCYPYMGLVTFSDWAALHRMMRLSGLVPKEFLEKLTEAVPEDAHFMARAALPAAPSVI